MNMHKKKFAVTALVMSIIGVAYYGFLPLITVGSQANNCNTYESENVLDDENYYTKFCLRARAMFSFIFLRTLSSFLISILLCVNICNEPPQVSLLLLLSLS